jgi:NADH-quinone oxidoreductase subunit H
MQEFVDGLIASGTVPEGVPAWVPYALAMLIFGGIVVFGFALLVAGVTSFIERRVWGRIQSRVGPNRVGPNGILQWLADGIKNMLKEDIIPAAADRQLFCLAPYIVVVGFVASWVVVPFASHLIIADLNIGILYLTAVTALVVVGILMAGWASNNKWALLGGIRSAAQIVSYEIPAGLSLFPVVLLAGTLSMQGIIGQQGWAPWDWYAFHSPFTFVAFNLFFISALAEGNRTPFDLPEAESELVAGFATEYSGMRSLLFFLAEWGNLYVIGAVVATLYLGGWQIPPITSNVVLQQVLQFAVFFLKAYFWVFVAMWIRATLPRVRVDQLMTICWKYLVPISFINLAGTAVTMVLLHAAPALALPLRLVVFAAAVAIVVAFLIRVRAQIRHARPELYYSPII